MNLETSKEIELKAFLCVYFLELELFMNLHIERDKISVRRGKYR